jgi:ABC-2 type transport system permease protein
LVILFLYLTGFQLLPLWNHHQNTLWVSLYPLKEEIREKSFHRLLLTTLFVESTVFTLVLLWKGEMLVSLVAFICAIAFCFYFVLFYSKKRLQLK